MNLLTDILKVISVIIFIGIVIFLNRWLLYPFLAILILYIFFTLIIKIISKFIPAFWIKGSDTKKGGFSIPIMVCTLFYYITGWYINRHVLEGFWHIKSLFINTLILLLALLLGRFILKPSRKIISFIVFCVFTLLGLTFISIESYEMDKGISSDHVKTLPYLSYVKEKNDVEKEGVVVYKKEQVNEGINLYNSWELPGAYLIDMAGNVLHKWWLEGVSRDWQYVKLLPNGDLLLIIKDSMLVCLDWNSNIKWINKDRFHHEIQIAENGDIYTLTRGERWVWVYGFPIPVLDDFLIVLSEDGRIKEKISFFKLLKEKIPFKILIKLLIKASSPEQIMEVIKRKWRGEMVVTNNTVFDIIHVNTLEIINKDFNNIFKKGNIIFCAAMLDIIGVIDMKKKKVLWTWGKGYLDLPHFPTLQKNGNILIFDNGMRRGFSRIIELNPLSQKVVWEYTENPPRNFFTVWGGANQILPNGNILVTISAKGRVLEITKKGEIVWEFYNPIKDESGRRGTIYRMTRITNIEKYNHLKKLIKPYFKVNKIKKNNSFISEKRDL